MLTFTLATLRQLATRPDQADRLRALLWERALRERSASPTPSAGPALAERLRGLEGEREVVARRMAREADDARYEAIARDFDRLAVEVRAVEQALAAARSRSSSGPGEVEAEVGAAMALLAELERVAGDPGARADLPPLLDALGLRIGLSFVTEIKGRKRPVQRLQAGVMAFGGAALPVPPYGKESLSALPGPCGCCADDVTEGEGWALDPAGCRETPRLTRHLTSTGSDDVPESAEPEQAARAGRSRSRGPSNAPKLPHSSETSRQEGISISKENRGERI